MHAADLGPVGPEQRTQSPFDLFLIFAGANIVATTLQTGATLAGAYGESLALVLIGAGALLGSALVAALAPVGPRLGVPSVVAARDALGWRGAGAVAGLLYLTNFAWFAINNVIAASVLARTLGPAGSDRLWSVALGVVATVIVARGPGAVRRADRVAVPFMIAVGVGLTWALWHQPPAPAPPPTGAPVWRGFDVVAGYQVSWLLMFADYPRYTRSPAKAATAVFSGLLLTSLWFMPIGFIAARAAASLDPGTMLEASGLGVWSAVLMALATITTNFVNLYMSTLAWKSLAPRAPDQLSVWSIGVIGTLLGLFSTTWLTRYADFMLVLGAILVPVGGVLFAHYVILGRLPRVALLYDATGPLGRRGGFRPSGVVAWAVGSATYFLAAGIGSTLPAVAAAILAYLVLDRVFLPPPTSARPPLPPGFPGVRP